jgi:hypothetical protein
MSIAARGNAPCAPLEKALPAPPAYEVIETKITPHITTIDETIWATPRDTWGSTSPISKVGGLKSVGLWITSWRSRSRSFQSNSSIYNQSDGWKPFTLRFTTLSCFIFISCSLVALLEVLSYYSTGNGNVNGGGLVFAAGLNDLPAVPSFFYLFFPTVIAVVYSMLWSWVDLDVKRLEPWFQLSRPEGATAQDSLLLHYPFEFLAFVPIRALRRRYVETHSFRLGNRVFSNLHIGNGPCSLPV